LALYPAILTFYTLEDSGINSLADAEGRVVGLGPRGTLPDNMFRMLFNYFGITPSSIHNDGHGASATAVGNGIIDLVGVFAYPPFPAIMELESTRAVSFVALNEEEIHYLVNLYDFLQADYIPGGRYAGAPEPVRTVSEWNILGTNRHVPEDVIYVVVKTLLSDQGLSEMLAVHPSMRHLAVENTLASANIYLHAGTVRALKELGYEVPANLIPPEFQR
jgi:TRAP transporter TAXI family solute receptor